MLSSFLKSSNVSLSEAAYSFGGIECLITDSTLIFLCCSGLNFLDLMVRQGNIDNPPKPPLVPGFECCGIVESVGEKTKGFEVGEMT